MTTNKIPRLCLFCEKFEFRAAEMGYSEYTPGSDVNMKCADGVWYLEENDLHDMLITAETCKKYKLNSWAKNRYNVTDGEE